MLTRWNDIGFGGLGRELSALNDLRNQMDRLFLDFERGWDAALRAGARVLHGPASAFTTPVPSCGSWQRSPGSLKRTSTSR